MEYRIEDGQLIISLWVEGFYSEDLMFPSGRLYEVAIPLAAIMLEGIEELKKYKED